MELEWFFMILESVESYPHYHPHFEDFHWRTLGGREYFAHRNEVILRCGEIPTAIHLILESWPRKFDEFGEIFWLRMIWWDLFGKFLLHDFFGALFLGGTFWEVQWARMDKRDLEFALTSLRIDVMDGALSTSHVANKIIFFIVPYTIY